jgi:hypothetical protein
VIAGQSRWLMRSVEISKNTSPTVEKSTMRFGIIAIIP